MADFGRILIIIGLTLVFVGGIILIAVRYFPWLGHLPGDFSFEGEEFKFYFPLVSMILLSLVGSILLNIVLRIFRR